MEKVTDLAPNQELKTYDENGIFRMDTANTTIHIILAHILKQAKQ